MRTVELLIFVAILIALVLSFNPFGHGAELADAPSVIDSKFVAAQGILWAGTLADIHSTKRFLNHNPVNGSSNPCRVIEGNSWMYGRQPSWGRMLAVGIPLTAGIGYLSYRFKKSKSPTLRAVWWIMPVGVGAGRGVVGLRNYGMAC
jgi:hypothetical protein